MQRVSSVADLVGPLQRLSTPSAYLPKEELVRFGCDGDLVSGAAPVPSPRFVRLVSFQVGRAQDFFAEGLRLLPLLDRIAQRPEAVLEGRVSLPAWQKAEIAVRSLLGMSP
jgi:phytoene synthase